MQEKRPRHYAAEIIQLTTREQRRDALNRVPEAWRELVAAHVRIAWQRGPRENDHE